MVVKKYFYGLVLLALIAFKVSAIAIHMHLHHGHEDSHEGACELCEHAIYSQNLAFSTPATLIITAVDRTLNFYPQKSLYTSICITVPINDSYFGRPPPLVVKTFQSINSKSRCFVG